MAMMTKEDLKRELCIKDDRTLMRLVKAGLLSYHQHGNRMMFTQDDIDDYLRKIRRVGRINVQPEKEYDFSKAMDRLKSALIDVLNAIDSRKT